MYCAYALLNATEQYENDRGLAIILPCIHIASLSASCRYLLEACVRLFFFCSLLVFFFSSFSFLFLFCIYFPLCVQIWVGFLQLGQVCLGWCACECVSVCVWVNCDKRSSMDVKRKREIENVEISSVTLRGTTKTNRRKNRNRIRNGYDADILIYVYTPLIRFAMWVSGNFFSSFPRFTCLPQARRNRNVNTHCNFLSIIMI